MAIIIKRLIWEALSSFSKENTTTYLLDNISIRFGSKLYRQIVGIPMRTNCAPLVFVL